jgi:hypothetical protein
MGLTRCSTPGQAGVGLSNDQQAELLKAFASKRDMIWVGEERAEGISGSQTDHREDLDNLFYRAETHKDYDILLVQSYDRLTRGGADHGGYLLHEFERRNVRVVSTSNDIPDNEYAPVIRSIEFIQGQGSSKSTSLHTTRGATAALFDGRIAYTRRTPYGIDKLVLSNLGEKQFRIRNLPDGTQVKLRWNVDDVLERYGRNPRRGVFVHFQKRKDEKIVLVPGAPEAVEVIKLIYEMYYIRGNGVQSIAMELNRRGVVSPKGGSWHQSSVYLLLHNPIFVQRGIANRAAQGMYHKRATRRGESPIRTKNPKKKLTYRPEEDWIVLNHPEIDFIPEDQRELAWKRQYQMLRSRIELEAADRRKGRPANRSNSAYPLLGAIFDKITGEPLISHRCGPEALHRYYTLHALRGNPRPENRWMPKFFPAAAIEKAALDCLAGVLGDAQVHLPLLIRYAKKREAELFVDVDEIASLKVQRDREQERKSFTATEYSDIGQERLKKLIAPLTAKIRELDMRIAAAESVHGAEPFDAEEIVRSVLAEMQRVGSSLGAPSLATLRSVLKVFTKTTVNLAAKEADIEIRLPERALSRLGEFKNMCEPSTSSRRIEQFAQEPNALILAKFRCKRTTVKRKACMTCSRLAKAA